LFDPSDRTNPFREYDVVPPVPLPLGCCCAKGTLCEASLMLYPVEIDACVAELPIAAILLDVLPCRVSTDVLVFVVQL
jgi:hypothetical protein